MRRLTVAILTFSFLAFKSGDGPCKADRLHTHAPFPIGVALDTEKLKFEEAYWTLAVAEFSSFTPEKILKHRYIHPTREAFDFNEIDHLIAFCKPRNIRIHGHTLVWDQALPAWVENLNASAEEWDAVMKVHIQTVIRHCKHYINTWDVVNEAFNDDGSLRDNIWKRHIGDSYIEKAYRYAIEADSSAYLFYNDHSLELNGKKLDAAISYFQKLRAKGVKIDGIGMQMHIGVEEPAISQINGAAMKIQSAEFMVHYSELDISLSGDGNFLSPTKRLYALQGERMKAVVLGYLQLNEESRFGITLWGVSDNDSWLTENRYRAKPLLFDNRYRPKPAYCGFREALSR